MNMVDAERRRQPRVAETKEKLVKKKLLAINFFPSFTPPITGGEQRSFFLLKALAQDFDVVSVVPTYPDTRRETVQLAPGLTEVRFPKTKEYSAVYGQLLREKEPIHTTAMSYALAGACHGAMLDYLAEIWDSIDGVVLQHATCAAILDALRLPRKPTFYLSHNCEFELAANAYTQRDKHDYACLMHQLEYRACQYSDLVVPVSQEDGEKFVHLFAVRPDAVCVAGNGSTDRFADADKPFPQPTNAASAIFLGSKWGPNLGAAKYICTELAAACPDITFHICGNVCDELRDIASRSNVLLHGILPDDALGDLLETTHIGLNPILDGAGSNVKLADYLAHGLCVVSTPKGSRGFEGALDNLNTVPLEQFPDTLNALAADKAPTAATRRKWRDAAREIWSWDEIARPLSDRMQQVLDNGPAPRQPINRILVINEFPVTGRESGGEARIAGLLSAPPENSIVTVLTFGRESFRLHRLSDRVACIELPLTRHQKEQVAATNRYSYTSADDVVIPQTAHRNPMFLLALETVVSHSDVAVMEHPFMWPVFRQIRSRTPLIYGSHNVEAIMKRATLDTHRMKHELCDQILEWEKALVQHAHAVCACSPGDADVYRQWGADAVTVIENGVTPLEDQHGEFEISPDRRVYLRRELAEIAPEQAGQIIELLLKRVPEDAEITAAAKALKQGGKELDTYLLGLVRSEENIQGNRVYVTGLLGGAAARPFSAVFMGTAHRPNLSAAELLVDSVAPACPDTDFLIVGKVGLSLQRTELPENVFICGFLSDELKTAVMLDCDLGLNPMIEGGGSNLKIPDYLVHGLDVISTPFGVRGFQITEDEGLHVAHVLEFPVAINRLKESLGTRARRTSCAPSVEQYYWSVLSERYFGVIKEAANDFKRKSLVVVDSPMRLSPNMLAEESRFLEEAMDREDVLITVFADPLKLDGQAPVYHDLRPRNIAYREHSRALEFSIPGLPAYGLFRKSICEIPGDAWDGDTLPTDEIICASGFSMPLFNGSRVHRFIRNEARILLPENTSSVRISGYATRSVTIVVSAGDEFIAKFQVHKKYNLTFEPPNGAPIRLQVQSNENYRNISVFQTSVEEITAVVNGLRKTASLLASFVPAERNEIDLCTNGVCLDQAEVVPRNVGNEMDRISIDRSHHDKLLVVGSQRFCKEFSGRGAEGGALVEYQVADLKDIATAEALDIPLKDWEIGLMANRRNRVGYRNKRNLGICPLVFMANGITSELVAIIEQTLGRLSIRYSQTKIVVLLPADKMRSQFAQMLSEHFAAAAGKVVILSPDSESEMLSIIAEAGLVVGYRLRDTVVRRLTRLEEVFDLSVKAWDGKSSAGRYNKVDDVDEILHEYWKRASIADKWTPSRNYGQASQSDDGIEKIYRTMGLARKPSA